MRSGTRWSSSQRDPACRIESSSTTRAMTRATVVGVATTSARSGGRAQQHDSRSWLAIPRPESVMNLCQGTSHEPPRCADRRTPPRRPRGRDRAGMRPTTLQRTAGGTPRGSPPLRRKRGTARSASRGIARSSPRGGSKGEAAPLRPDVGSPVAVFSRRSGPTGKIFLAGRRRRARGGHAPRRLAALRRAW